MLFRIIQSSYYHGSQYSYAPTQQEVDQAYDAVELMWRNPIHSPDYLLGWNYLQSKMNEWLLNTQQYMNSPEAIASSNKAYTSELELARLRGNPPPAPRPTPQESYQRYYNATIQEGRLFINFLEELKQVVEALPNFTARVKIATNAPQNPGKKCLSCGYQSNSGNKYCKRCGKQLPAPNEYIIKTLPPGQGIGKVLQQRIAAIQAKNRQDGYTRAKQVVEAEIIKRQAGCSGLPPAQAQPQPPSPQQPKRYGRQVPIQEFCNQCGTKL